MTYDVHEARLIAQQNDAFRTSLGRNPALAGQIVRTASLSVFGPVALFEIVERVRNFAQFTPNNDPYGQHDYGTFVIDVDGSPQTICWRIDLYDTAYEWGSAAPSDPERTRRVLTIMLPEDQ